MDIKEELEKLRREYKTVLFFLPGGRDLEGTIKKIGDDYVVLDVSEDDQIAHLSRYLDYREVLIPFSNLLLFPRADRKKQNKRKED